MVSGPSSVHGFLPLKMLRPKLAVPGNSLLSGLSRLVSAFEMKDSWSHGKPSQCVRSAKIGNNHDCRA